MNGKKARAIRKAVYGDTTIRNRTYYDSTGKPVGIGPVHNRKRDRVGVRGDTMHADQMRKLYQHAKKMHRTGRIKQANIKFN